MELAVLSIRRRTNKMEQNEIDLENESFIEVLKDNEMVYVEGGG